MADQRMDVRKLLLEAVAIVASILVAFAIDSSWDEFQEDKQRQYALNALRADIAVTYQGAVFHKGYEEDKVSKLLSLLDVTNRPTDEMEVEEFVGLIRDAIEFSTYLPPTGAMDSLVGSGELNNLLGAELRADLAEYQKDLESMYRTQRWGLAFVNEELTAYLGERVPLVIFGFSGEDYRETFDSYYSEDEVAVYARELAGALEFQNLIHTRLLIAGLLRMKTGRLLERIEGICTRLRAECSPDEYFGQH